MKGREFLISNLTIRLRTRENGQIHTGGKMRTVQVFIEVNLRHFQTCKQPPPASKNASQYIWAS